LKRCERIRTNHASAITSSAYSCLSHTQAKTKAAVQKMLQEEAAAKARVEAEKVLSLDPVPRLFREWAHAFFLLL
jgi:hypothetical protein